MGSRRQDVRTEAADAQLELCVGFTWRRRGSVAELRNAGSTLRQTCELTDWALFGRMTLAAVTFIGTKPRRLQRPRLTSTVADWEMP